MTDSCSFLFVPGRISLERGHTTWSTQCDHLAHVVLNDLSLFLIFFSLFLERFLSLSLYFQLFLLSFFGRWGVGRWCDWADWGWTCYDSDVLAFLERGGAGAKASTGKAVEDTSGHQAAAARQTEAAAYPKEEEREEEEAYHDTPTSNIRQIIARRLTESKSQIPHEYARIEVDMSAASKLRKQIMGETGSKFSLNDVILKASGLSLRAVPEVNTTFVNGEATVQPSVDISVAVASPRGLITPIVTRSESRSVLDIAGTVQELAGRARDGKLKPHEFQGGSFSVSNLGMFGVSEFSAVINPPQTCILAVGTIRPRIHPETHVCGLLFSFFAACRASRAK